MAEMNSDKNKKALSQKESFYSPPSGIIEEELDEGTYNPSNKVIVNSN